MRIRSIVSAFGMLSGTTDRLACFPGRWDTSVEGQERFAQDCEAAGIVLDGP